MKQQEIKYKDIKDLGFTEEIQKDSVYFDEYGYHYAIISLDLTKLISLDWEKETRLCKMIRIDSDGNIIQEKKIIDLEDLKSTIKFFLNSKDINQTDYLNAC